MQVTHPADPAPEGGTRQERALAQSYGVYVLPATGSGQHVSKWGTAVQLSGQMNCFGLDIERNAVHGSDSVKTAEQEIKLFFKDSEILSYERKQ